MLFVEPLTRLGIVMRKRDVSSDEHDLQVGILTFNRVVLKQRPSCSLATLEPAQGVKGSQSRPPSDVLGLASRSKPPPDSKV